MPLLVFLLIGAVWAAFLLPSFFESRRHAPMSATRSFQRSTELLGSVAGVDAKQVMARRRQATRRRRLLFFLSVGAVLSLGIAILTGSMFALGTTLVFDLLIGAYVTLLLMTRQRAYAIARAPRIGVAEAPAEQAPYLDAAQPGTVRVVAG